ncbi:MAG: chromosome segregation protein SMC [Gammaproteobacteria bacterium]
MRLIKLQISGFKSFVDSTDIRLPADLVAVVGPNGCGKSNIIDAVRWVMGEASARMLRGDSMADVIFNGSSARKPVGKASVELLFDNSDGAAGGSFASFAEISIMRSLSRDGQSNYFINRIKARRRDVLDLFRGTGLGPRSYAIIEQGMVSRIVEAHPEDLRLFVEEAAGTSKYKDRRRETETRMAHTRDNLARIADIRDELGKQLRRLKRQASSAKRFRALRDEQRLVGAQLLLLQLGEMEDDLSARADALAKHEKRLQSANAAQRKAEEEIEAMRLRQSEAQEKHHHAQREMDALGADMKNLEQRIGHLDETSQQRGAEITRLRESGAQRKQRLKSAQTRLRDLRREEAQLAPQAEALAQTRRAAAEQLEAAESGMENWRAEWEEFTMQSQQPGREREVQKSLIAQLEQHLARTAAERERCEQELAGLRESQAAMDIEAMRAEVRKHDQACERAELEFQQGEETLQSLQQRAQGMREQGERARARRHQAESRLASLREIQSAELDPGDAALRDWLAAGGLKGAPKLAARIRVADGWERAADRLLSGCLGALCVESLPHARLAERPDCAFMLLAAGEAKPAKRKPARARLLDMVDSGGADLSGFLGGVYVAESLHAALAMQPDLAERECAVTRDGALVGANWVSFASSSQLETGVLAREEEMQQLQNELAEVAAEVETGEREVAQLETSCQTRRNAAQQQRAALEQLRRDKTGLHGKLGREEARHLEMGQRIDALGAELANLAAHAQSDRDEIARARELLERAAGEQGELESKRDELTRRKPQLQDAIAKRRAELQRAGEQVHAQAMQKQRIENETAAAGDDIARLERESAEAETQLAGLHAGAGAGESAKELKANLQRMRAERGKTDKRLSAAAAALAGFDARIEKAGARRAESIEAVAEAREALLQHNLDKREAKALRDVQADLFERQERTREELAASLPPATDAGALKKRAAALARKIGGLGAVNLVAIDEFDEESERKEYLDKQHADLSEALDTLGSVIRKIDRETRARFKDTFERLNAGFNDFFPRLFGGGRAELRLTDDDFLTAGIIVMARPPGKRNTHIHLLSGGEKALTAVALLFALFKLNPAPFCMLDEVDAPLDDANVERYCNTLKSLVEVSQMIVITHNKITMEAADVLLGVTMGEPGVSRLVSVDVEQAVEMAAQ